MKLRFLAFIVCLAFSFTTTASPHKFYISITSLDYNLDSKSLEIIIKFFTDDLEASLENGQPIKLYLATEKENKATDSLLQEYLNSHFILQQKEKKLPIVFIGKEADRDYTYVYLELVNFNESKTTTLINTLLIDLYEEQVNKVNYKNNEKSKSFSMHKDLFEVEF